MKRFEVQCFETVVTSMTVVAHSKEEAEVAIHAFAQSRSWPAQATFQYQRQVELTETPLAPIQPL